MSEGPLKLFISYSHKDEKMREALGTYLDSMQNEGLIQSWHDRKISAGSEWANEIDSNLDVADIILLLVSENFMSSKYCFDIELKRAMTRHNNGDARVIPIILKPVSWSQSVFGKLQALPREGKAVTRWSTQAEAFYDIDIGIRNVAAEMMVKREHLQEATKQSQHSVDAQVADVSDAQAPSREKKSSVAEFTVVESNGSFYIIRPEEEKRCRDLLLKQGALLRIKSPDNMGKTQMMRRVLHHLANSYCRTAMIDLRQANQETYSDINRFLQWFCDYTATELGIDHISESSWAKRLSPNLNCKNYFEKYLLNASDQPLVVAIDNFDCLFDHPNIETDFCGLLRGWFESASTPPWGKLRQIIVYSLESLAAKDINQSPLNVGSEHVLDELNKDQITALAIAYGLDWGDASTLKLMSMIGGNPYLVQKALEGIGKLQIPLDDLLKKAPTEEGVFGNYLMDRLGRIENDESLLLAMKQVVTSQEPVMITRKAAFNLYRLGLIRRENNNSVSRCELYRKYFMDRLS